MYAIYNSITGTSLRRILLFLMNGLFILLLAVLGGQKTQEKIPRQARTQFQNMWKEERAKRISQATKAIGISFAATYVFGLVGLAGHYNWTAGSIAAYSPLFFNLSLASAAFTWHYHAERKSLIKKKRLSEDEIHIAYMKMKNTQQFQTNYV